MKNNAKKKKLYEAFIETLPLLTSLEVWGSPPELIAALCIYIETTNQMSYYPQLSERMKVVDVLSTKVYNGSQQIIAQVTSPFVCSTHGLVFFCLNRSCCFF